MSAAAAHSVREVPDIEGSASAEIATSLTQIMSSLEDLASKCRSQGLDPMAMIMTTISAAAGGRGGAVGGADEEAARAPARASMPSDAEIIQQSRDLIHALDHGDVATVTAALAPGFVRFAGGTTIDRDAMLMMTIQHRSNAPEIAERTWDNETVVRKDDTVVFTGKAHEVQAGNETKGGYLHDGWYLLQWVRAGDGWRVQLLTWQKESTESDRFNEIYRKGRGFSRVPNRLLVDTVRGKEPGTALDLAMGQGRNALYLASQGWKVTGVDGSEEGLVIAREEAVKRELALETINANIDEWEFSESHFDLVTLLYAGDHVKWVDKIKASLRAGGLFVVEGWAKEATDSPVGFCDGELARMFADGYDILRDESVEDVPDWAWDKGQLARFVARKR